MEYIAQGQIPQPVSSTTSVYKKFRYIDPLFIQNQQLVRLSDAEFALLLEQERQHNQQQVTVATWPIE